ncbi:MAG TPA: class IV adenylate cyclase [Blastocatellia bacterium]|nr:class IV adenylate cyclase [Blastocatellia bacterium]
MSHEIEVKLRLGIQSLAQAGITLELLTPRHFEDNWLLDTTTHQLAHQSSVLRVRSADGKGVLTYKEKAGQDAPASQFKLRIELETELGSAPEALAIFDRLGFHRFFRYQKYRSVYEATLPSQNHLHVMVDETPLGDFLELEGEEAAIAEAVQLMGLTPADYILDSYIALQLRHCQQQGKPLEDMVF